MQRNPGGGQSPCYSLSNHPHERNRGIVAVGLDVEIEFVVGGGKSRILEVERGGVDFAGVTALDFATAIATSLFERCQTKE